MTTLDKLASLLFAATCVREVIDATQDHGQLNQLARIHLGITDVMDALKKHAGLS